MASRTGRRREILAHSSNVGTITIADKRLGGGPSCASGSTVFGIGEATGVDLPGRAARRRLRRRQVVRHGDPERADRRGHRGHAAADGCALRLDRQQRSLAPAAHHGRDRNQADDRLEEAASSCRRTSPGSCAACSPTVVEATAPANSPRVPGYSVAGKTGTTPKYDAKHGTYCDPGKDDCEYQTSFVGFAPAKNPRFVALIMVDEPHDKDGDSSMLEGGDRRRAGVQARIAQGILQELRVPADHPRRAHAGPATKTRSSRGARRALERGRRRLACGRRDGQRRRRRHRVPLGALRPGIAVLRAAR